MVSESVSSELRSAINDAHQKSASLPNSRFLQNVSEATVEGAKESGKIAESKITRYQTELDDVKSQLAGGGPTKEVAAGGKSGGMMTVADTEKKDKLQRQEGDLTASIAQARAEVDQAQQEADAATAEALVQAGFTSELQSQVDSLFDKVDSLQTQAGQDRDDPVLEEQISSVVREFEKLSDDMPENSDSKEFHGKIADEFAELLNSIGGEGDEEVPESVGLNNISIGDVNGHSGNTTETDEEENESANSLEDFVTSNILEASGQANLAEA